MIERYRPGLEPDRLEAREISSGRILQYGRTGDLAKNCQGPRPSHAERSDQAMVSDSGTNRQCRRGRKLPRSDPKDYSIDEVMRATRDGELFLFVNDAVLGIPGLEGVFYSNNVGKADVTVTRR